MDAWRDGDQFVVKLDLPGLNPDCLDIHVEHDSNKPSTPELPETVRSGAG
ncbi:hypothetical protein [Mycobacterium palustre]|nr:hypothetical protein [Mycobacterium palustre]MCV7100507.1 hypothetical protein [Mycobacterium palustre]